MRSFGRRRCNGIDRRCGTRQHSLELPEGRCPGARDRGQSMKRDLAHGVLAAASVAVALALGQIATFPNLEPWYASLAKPVFNPPNWLFGPVWTTLYVLMAFALWRVMRHAAQPMRGMAVAMFYVQLLLNAAWPWMFFAAQSPALGLINIVPQLIVI